MIDRVALLKDAQRQVKDLEKDLRAQVDEVVEVGTRLRAEYDRAFKVGRTAATWSAWLGERVTQAAVAWVLGTVFVRFCEDNGLIGDPFLAGPTTARLTLAEERTEDFYTRHPEKTARDWLLAAFDEIAKVPVGAALFDQRHNALFQIPLTHDAAKNLLAFWRRRTEAGILVHDFTDATWDTRFLGDLYQDLSEDVRKKYALLQTPEFVEEFILDLTLTPAIDEFGYDVVKLIDPTCGSGHFLLGAFRRLLAEWDKHAPDRDIFERVRLALDAIHGVDINPYATAIAKFRLTIEALRAAGLPTLDAAAGYTFPLHVATGDSLIKYRQLGMFGEERDDLAEFAYATEDLADHPGILEGGRYHAVTGNPPYITVKDKKLNELYRGLYDACSGTYALSVPFAQRFFELAKRADLEGRRAGSVGQITANSFMKREFGRKMIQDLFATKVELTHVIDTSGAYIPGHGTPTVILIGRNNSWHRPSTVRAVLGIRGEPSVPASPRNGLVWQAITNQVGDPGTESTWTSCADRPREDLMRFPWSLSGGSAPSVVALLSDGKSRLGGKIQLIGRMAHTGSDDAYFGPIGNWKRFGISNSIRMATGNTVRDWSVNPESEALFPYDENLDASIDKIEVAMILWRSRAALRARQELGGTHEQIGLTWYEWSRWHPDRFSASFSIGFPFVSTHASFSLSKQGIVFNRTAPAIKLKDGTPVEEHLRLLGVLNS
ncbi:BREX-2 system adenine-specific DNA-methyltransferase PglX, partial [Frankia sp. AgKG'84/4]